MLVLVRDKIKIHHHCFKGGVTQLFLLFLASCVRTLGSCSFQGKVFILSLPNLVWLLIGLIACMGLLFVKIAL